MPHSNQHIEPALNPAMTMPASHASRRMRVEPLGLPDREQVDHRAAADVDRVLRQQVLAQRHRPAAEAEQRDVRRLAQPVAVRLVVAADLVLGVASRGGQQADARARPAGQLEHQLVERGIAGAGGEAAAAHRQDRGRPPLRRQAPAPRRAGRRGNAWPARSLSLRSPQAPHGTRAPSRARRPPRRARCRRSAARRRRRSRSRSGRPSAIAPRKAARRSGLSS